LCDRSQSRLRFSTDAFDHGSQTVRSLRGEVLPQTDTVEKCDRIGRQNVLRALAGIEREKDCDQAAHDMRVAVTFECEDWSGRPVRPDVGEQPYLARASLDLIGVDVGAVRQR